MTAACLAPPGAAVHAHTRAQTAHTAAVRAHTDHTDTAPEGR